MSKNGRRYTPEHIRTILYEGEVLQSQGMSIEEAAWKQGIAPRTYYRWGKEYREMDSTQARKKRIGARMTDLPLLDARTMGYRAAILHASGMGESVYRLFDFEEYWKIGKYIWAPRA
jgi:hypothetical protein